MPPDISPLFGELRAYKQSRVLGVALHKGVLDCLLLKPKSAAEISQEKGIAVPWLLPMCGVLAELGLLQPVAIGFELTDLGRTAVQSKALKSFAGYHFHCFSAWERLPEVCQSTIGGKFHLRTNSDSDFSEAYLRSLDTIAQRNVDFLHEQCREIFVGKVLDLAAGPATLTREFARWKPEITVTALDLPAISSKARELFSPGEPRDNFQWVSGDFWEWETRELYNVIYCSHFLEYCGTDRLPQFLERIKGVLANNGDVIFVTFLRGGSNSSGLDLFELSTGLNGESIGHVFSEKEIRTSLRKAGMEVVDLQYLPAGPSYQEAFIHCRK